jgi:hypothetical protein
MDAPQEQTDAEFFHKLGERAIVAERREKEASRARDRAAQLMARKLDLVPFPKSDTRPFRSELTVEQNTLFASNDFEAEWRMYEQRIAGAEPILQRVTVGKIGKKGRPRGVLKQIHQDVFYRLLELWGEMGYPLMEHKGEAFGIIVATAYVVVTAIRGNDGDDHYERAKNLVVDLASIPVVLENVYTWNGLRDREQFTLLEGVRWSEHKIDESGHLDEAEDGNTKVRILFSPFVTEGFLHKNVKTLLAQPYDALCAVEPEQRNGEAPAGKRKGCRAEIARLLYPFLDTQLATKDEYHAKLDALAERFGLTRYHYKSKRREKFLRAVTALNGRLILGERYALRTALRESQDGTDFVLVARREPTNQLPLFR